MTTNEMPPPQIGPVYRVEFPSATPGSMRVVANPGAMAFKKWLLEGDVEWVEGTMASGPHMFVADFPMKERPRVEAWLVDNGHLPSPPPEDDDLAESLFAMLNERPVDRVRAFLDAYPSDGTSNVDPENIYTFNDCTLRWSDLDRLVRDAERLRVMDATLTGLSVELPAAYDPRGTNAIAWQTGVYALREALSHGDVQSET